MDWFAPTLRRIEVVGTSWEALIDELASREPEGRSGLGAFYREGLDVARGSGRVREL